MTRARFTRGVAILATGFTGGCAHFWKMPGEPLTTAQICERGRHAQVLHDQSPATGLGIANKDRLTVQALYDQAMVDRFAAPGLISQANAIQSQSNWSYAEANWSGASGVNWWAEQCRLARKRDRAAAYDRDTAILIP